MLAPAGNRECLETAFAFGADAVYIAGKQFGLRAFAANFTDDEIKSAAGYARGLDKKLYVTVNAALREGELPELGGYLRFLRECGVDGIIFSDPAVLQAAKREGIAVPLHLSTQANTMNSHAAQFWREAGVRRIVLSRECTLKEVSEIKRGAGDLEIEVFVHGAMCIAHSGRCLMSSFMTGRSGNRGECAQPCRWEYFLHERGYDGEYFPVSEDGRGAYVLNSKDLMMIEYIPELIEAGVTSLKIEGRMKSVYYVASVVGAYRRALDGYKEHGAAYVFDNALKEELEKSATRLFTTGFFFGNPGGGAQDTVRGVAPRKYTFCAKVTAGAENGVVQVEQRNKFSVGEELETLSPHLRGAAFTVEYMENEDGARQQSAPHAQQKLKINCPFPLRAGDLLRRHD